MLSVHPLNLWQLQLLWKATRFRSVFMGSFDHSFRSAFVQADPGEKACLEVTALIHLKGVLSGWVHTRLAYPCLHGLYFVHWGAVMLEQEGAILTVEYLVSRKFHNCICCTGSIQSRHYVGIQWDPKSDPLFHKCKQTACLGGLSYTPVTWTLTWD